MDRSHPTELYHARRHVLAAIAEWEAGRACAARAHLREVIPDVRWALRVVTAACEVEAAE